MSNNTIVRVKPTMTAAEINEILKGLPNGAIVQFEKGEYHMKETFEVYGKSNLSFCLGEAVLRPYFNPENGDYVPTDSIDVFHFENCEQLSIYGGIVKSDSPTNVSGRVTAVSEEYLEVRLFPRSPLTGREKLLHGRTLDELARPCGCHIHDYPPTSKRYELVKNDRIPFAGQLVCTNPPFRNMEVEFVEDDLCRIRNIHSGNFKVGMSCTLAYVYYGSCAFVFTACKNVLMDGTRFSSFGGMGVVILPDSRDFTFRNVVMKSDESDCGVEPVQADGIHIAGCGGKLVFDNCYWEYTVDDALNVHAQLLTVSKSDGGKIELIYDKLYGKVLRHWASRGDILRVYDQKTKLLKGTVTVLAAGANTALTDADKSGVDIAQGDYITNSAHFCELFAYNCRLVSCTGGLKLRSINSACIHNCVFDGCKKSVVMSVAFATTKEGGPVKDVLIEENEFLNTGYDPIIYSGVYSGDVGIFEHLHENITLRGNTFANSTARCLVELTATDGVVIENNVVKNCKNPFFELSYCNGVVCGNNKTE